MRQVRISEFKAHLSECLAAVRHGETIEVLDRNTPVALVSPIAAPSLVITRAKRRAVPLEDVRSVPPRLAVTAQEVLDAVRGER
jgi:prevent-host-death family protein